MRATVPSLLAILTLLCALHSLSASCGEGCLACSADSSNNFTCDICDAHNQFFKRPGSTVCEKIEIPNCEVASVDFLCFLCAPGYILDGVGGKCLKVHAGAVVPFCYRYSQSGVCVQCNPSYYMSNFQCLATEKDLSDCEIYRSPQECLTCKSGFYLQERVDDSIKPPVVKQGCVKITEKNHCLAYSLAECDICKTGKIINKNYSISASLQGSFLQNVMVLGRETLFLNQREGPVCVTPAASHCQIIKSSTGECEKCSTGYYRNDNNLCVPNPEDAVLNCAVYSSPNNCSRCHSHFYLNGTTCTAVTNVDHCSIYSPSTGSCTNCITEFYLNVNVCQPRTHIIIPQCTKLSVTSDNCDTCQTGYLKFSDNLGCQIEIPNCQSPLENSSNPALPRFSCQTCNVGFFPVDSGRTCQKYFVANCLNYNANTNTCLNCLNANFYKEASSGRCIMKKVPNCTTPNSATPTHCDTCKPGYYKDTNNKCHAYTVNNCVSKHASKDECLACDLGTGSAKIFYLDASDKRCKAYSLSICSNPEPAKNECITCGSLSGYALDPVSKTCRKIPMAGCSSYNWTTRECSDCNNRGTEWFLDGTTKTCQRYSLEGCKSGVNHSTTANQCGGSLCDPGFYLKGTLCVRYDLIGCTGTKHTTLNKCTAGQCQAGKFWFDATSGLCKPYSIDTTACTTLSTTADECTSSQCKSNFYQDSITKNCHRATLPGCTTPKTSDRTKCTTCDTDFVEVTAGSDKKCYPRTKFNCKTTAANLDECATCEAELGYTLSSTKNCVRASVHGCKQINSSGVCITCNDGLVISGAGATLACKVPLRANCVTFAADGKCSTCSYGYSPNGGTGDCDENTSTNCSLKSSTDGLCVLCNYNFYKNGSGVCTAITKKNCFETNKSADECVSCLPGFKLDTNSCNLVATVDVDQNCKSSAQTDGKCDSCKSGYFPFVSNYKTTSVPNCFVFSSGACTQCNEGYALQASGTPICKKEDTEPDATLCVQNIASQTVTLAANTKCAKCKDPSKYFLTSDVCTIRTAANETFGCGEHQTSADGCLSCSTDKPPFTGEVRSICVKQKQTPASVVVTNLVSCLSQTEAALKTGTSVCDICGHLALWDSSLSPAACAPVVSLAASVDLLVDKNFHPFGKPPKFDNGTDCIKNMQDPQSSNAKFCVECEKGKFSILSLGADYAANYKGDNMKSFWDPQLGSYSFAATLPKLTCSTAVTQLVTISGTAVTPNNCAVYGVEPDTSSVTATSKFCVSCQKGYKGKVEAANQDRSSGAFLAAAITNHPIHFSLDCSDKTDEFQKKYHGLGYLIGETNSVYIDSDTCVNGKHLIYFGNVVTLVSENHFVIGNHIDSTGSLHSKQCSALDNPISNCQIYYHTAATNGAVVFNVKTSSSLKCLSCQPGFKLTQDGANPYGTACTRISKCLIAAGPGNMWMNACNTCEPGYSWGYASKTINYSQCVWNNGDHNCAAVSAGSCVLCHRNYDLHNGKCFSQSELGDSNCVEWGFGKHSLTLVADGDASEFRATGGFFYHFFGDSKWAVGCGKCKPGFDLVSLIANSKTCHKAPFPIQTIQNCLNLNIKDLATGDETSVTCDKCTSGYILNSDDKGCFKSHEDRYKGCAKVNSTFECVSCHSDHLYFTASKLCVSNEDLETEVSNFSSLVFKEGKRPVNFTDQINVIISIQENNECRQYAQGKCIKCKEPNTIPLHLANRNLVDGVKEVRCVEFERAEELYPMYLQTDYSNFANTTLEGLANFKYGTGLYSVADSDNPKLCARKNRSDPNCLEDESFFGCKQCAPGFHIPPNSGLAHCTSIQQSHCVEWKFGHCFKCHNDFFLRSDFTCEARTVRACKTFSKNYDQCTECFSGFYFSATAGCTAYTRKFCKTFFQFGDYCSSCQSGYAFDKTNGKCTAQDITGCLTFYKSGNTCQKCKAGYYLKTDSCFQYTIQNCSEPNPYENTCLKCDLGCFMDASRICQIYSVNDCLDFHPTENKCATCPRNRFLNDTTGLCLAYSVQNCKLFSPVLDKCDKCLDGTYPAQDGNCKTYSARNCKDFSPVEDGCLSCLPGFFKDKLLCREYSVENCSVFDPSRDKCLDCRSGFYLNDDRHCLAYTGSACKVRLRHLDQCAICIDGNFLTSNGRCKPYTLERCSIKNQFKDECLSCEPGTFLQSHRCHIYNAQNCRSYHPFKNECESCRKGFFRTETGTCNQYTLENCQVSDPYKDFCDQCEDKHYLDSTYKCRPYTHPCKTFNNFSDDCLTCPEAHHLTHDFKCEPNSIEHCKTYQDNKKLCTVCDSGYLLWENHCVKYTARNCQTFKPSEDKCLLCNSGAFYMNPNSDCVPSTAISQCSIYRTTEDACNGCLAGFYLIGTSECRKNPEGISKCIEYDNLATCRRCDNGWYLINNVCYQSTVTVPNCDIHIGEGICGKCVSGMVLGFNNDCVSPSNTTCFTFLDKDNCKTCNSNQVLKKVGEVMNCVDSGILNCASAVAGDSTNTCSACLSGHILKDNACNTPTTPISGCQDYLSETECSVCNADHVLSFDKKSCHNDTFQLDGSCKTGHFNEIPKCYLCAPGYRFDDSGNCVKCGGNIDGCDICGTGTSNCRMCMKGYFMTKDFLCVKYSASSLRVIEDDGSQPDLQEKSASIANALSYLVGCLLVVFFADRPMLV